jgi:glycerol-3-phosphate acyltransferase PlsX
MLRAALRSTPAALLGGLLAKRALTRMKQRVDWRSIGGAPLVGVAGVGFVTHGRSDAFAMRNAVARVRLAADAHATEEMGRAAERAEALLAIEERLVGTVNHVEQGRASVAPHEA